MCQLSLKKKWKKNYDDRARLVYPLNSWKKGWSRLFTLEFDKVKSKVQSIRDINLNIKGRRAGVTQLRKMRRDAFFLAVSIFLEIFLSPSLSFLICLFIAHFFTMFAW